MAQRSRKRRSGPPAAPTSRAVGAAPEGSAPPAAPARDDGVRRGYARGRERDDVLRAGLEPLAPGERPLAVRIAAVVAAAIAIGNLVLYLSGWQVRGQEPNLLGTLALCVLLLAAAAGMWRLRYWAVLGFEVLLGVLIVSAALSLLVASNLRGALLALSVIALAGPLFWSLIRTMARIQMPERRRDTQAR